MRLFAIFSIFIWLGIAATVYFMFVRPKLTSFRYTAGIYQTIHNFELGFWARLTLWLKGLKVALIGLITSSMPVLVVFYDQISGVDWSKYLPDEKAKLIAAVVALLGVFGPIVMVILHQGALAEASADHPVQPPSTVPPK